MHKCLFGGKELAEILDISKQALQYRIKGGRSWYGNDIPAPAYRVSAGALWTYEQIKEHIDKSSPYGDWGRSKERFKAVSKRLMKQEV